MSVTLTPEQLGAIIARITATCTAIEVRRWDTTGRTIGVDYFARQRLIASVKVAPGGRVTVLS